MDVYTSKWVGTESCTYDGVEKLSSVHSIIASCMRIVGLVVQIPPVSNL